MSSSSPPRVPARVAADSTRQRDGRAIIALQRRLVERAHLMGASDLHLEPSSAELVVRVRVDGWLHELERLPGWLREPLVSRFKVLARMDIAERRLPQDGRATVTVAGERVDLRVATIGARHGEVVVVRLLPRGRRPPRLGELGLDGARLEVLLRLLSHPQGLILATGPTGAGKTTTLYALLRELDSRGRKVVTLEDPIEYALPGAVQIPVRHELGLGFPRALRAVLRQDPDVILVGEIRDEETARVGLRASMTGHLVLSTLHANNAPEAALRLRDLGVPAYVVGSALRGVVSQRLARRLCPACSLPCRPTEDDLEGLGLGVAATDSLVPPLRGPRGCSACRQGYRGRLGLFETLRFGDPLPRLLGRGSSASELRRAALAEDLLLPLAEAALGAVLDGRTSPQEALRVAGRIGRAEV